MSMDKEILETLREMSQAQEEIIAKQEEAPTFLRAEAEREGVKFFFDIFFSALLRK